MIEITFKHSLIFVPMLVVVALTIVGFIRMAYVRFKFISTRQMPLKYYVAFQGNTEPEHVAVVVRHYANLFEAPIIFYAACLTLFALAAVTPIIYLTAWAYAVMRVAQSAIHLTYNNVRHRAYAFLLGWVALAVLWGEIAAIIFAKAA